MDGTLTEDDVLKHEGYWQIYHGLSLVTTGHRPWHVMSCHRHLRSEGRSQKLEENHDQRP